MGRAWAAVAILVMSGSRLPDWPLLAAPVFPETPTQITDIEADLRQGRFDAALTKARALTQAEPRNALAFTFLGMASLHLNELDQARSAFERSIQLDAADPRPHLNLALLYASRNQLDKAIHSYQQGLALDHRNPTAHYNLGRLLLTSGRFVEAAKALEESLQLRGGDAEAQIALVEALLGAGQRDRARRQAELCLQSSLPAEMVTRLGTALVRGNETALAETALERARAAAPNSPAVYIELSRLRSTLKQHEGAVLAARHAVKLAPQALEGYLALAEALISGKRHLEAVDTLSEVQSQFQSSASFHYTLGVAQSGAHLPQPAIKSLERAVNLDPRYDVAQFLLGIAYYRVGNLEKAEKGISRCHGSESAQRDLLYLSGPIVRAKGTSVRDAGPAGHSSSCCPRPERSREQPAFSQVGHSRRRPGSGALDSRSRCGRPSAGDHRQGIARQGLQSFEAD